jgi:Protein of unknown function (DUF3047)
VRIALSASLLIALAIAISAAASAIFQEDFEHGLSSRWKITRLGRGRGSAQIDADSDGNHFLRVTTANAFYGVGIRGNFDTTQDPGLNWRWRIERMPTGADIARKDTDDAAARIYVVFRRRSLLHPFGTRALVYVWDASHPRRAAIPNPYAPDDEMAIVMETGAKNLGRWMSESADLVHDYSRAFGETPGRIVAIVCASDSDNTHSASQADFDDIMLASRVCRISPVRETFNSPGVSRHPANGRASGGRLPARPNS